MAAAQIGEAVDVGDDSIHNETTTVSLPRSTTASNLVATVNTGAKAQHRNIAALDRVDGFQRSGQCIAQNVRFLGVRIRPCGVTATQTLLQDPENWIKRLFGHFFNMRNDGHCGQAKVKINPQFSAWFRPKSRPSHRRKARGRTTTNLFMPHLLSLRSSLSVGSRNSTRCQTSGQCLSDDRSVDAPAKKLGKVILSIPEPLRAC